MRRRSPRFILLAGQLFSDLPLIREALARFGPGAKVTDLARCSP